MTYRFSLLHTMIAGLCLALLLPACNDDAGQQQAQTPADRAKDSVRLSDSASKAAAMKAQESYPEIRYQKIHIGSRQMLDSIHRVFGRSKGGDSAFRVITTMNRKEFGYIRMGDSIVIPEKIMADLRAYSVFPQRYPGADTIAKLLIVSNPLQCYGCYEHGKLVRFAAVNTGRESKPTFPGRYSLIWKERLRHSSLDSNWKLPFNWNFHLYAGSAFHQFTMPGRPVSHSCCRQFMPDAKWLFDWGVGGEKDGTGHWVQFSGTPVIILGMFDFTRPKFGPWVDLKSNRDGIIDLPKNPMAVEEALIPISQVPVDARGALPDRQRYKTAEDTLRARGILRSESRLSPSVNYNAIRKAKYARAARAKKAKDRAAATPVQNAPAEPEVKPVN